MQLKYNLEMDPAIVGMLADLTDKTTDSFTAEEALEPGQAVILGTNPQEQVKAAKTTGDPAKIIGIVMHTHKELTSPYYPVGYRVPVLTKGRVWVNVSNAVTAGKTAYYNHDSKCFSASEGETTTNCVFKTTTAGAGMAIVQIN